MSHILDNVGLWNLFRSALDACFGHYRIRVEIMRGFGINRSMSILDVGCGTGQFSQITDSDYLGIDMDCKYIEDSRKKYGSEKKRFECVSLQDARFERQYDVSLMVDLTHHISDDDLRDLLVHLKKVTSKFVVFFDPVKQDKWNILGRLITSLDRGKFIRSRETELNIISEYFNVLNVKNLKMLHINGIAVFAKPK